jgi:lactobin A/cerein 7B family class IIb bacteriocin
LAASASEKASSAAYTCNQPNVIQESKMLKDQEITNDIGMRALDNEELEAVNGGIVGELICLGVLVAVGGGMFHLMFGSQRQR